MNTNEILAMGRDMKSYGMMKETLTWIAEHGLAFSPTRIQYVVRGTLKAVEGEELEVDRLSGRLFDEVKNT